MQDWAVVDTNMLLLLVVGRADHSLVAAHKRLRQDYSLDDFERLEMIVDNADGLVVVPQVLAEVSNFARQIAEPARQAIGKSFARLIATSDEVFVPSERIIPLPYLLELGLSDAILLSLCSERPPGRRYALLTNDQPLVFRAQSLGLSVLNFSEL